LIGGLNWKQNLNKKKKNQKNEDQIEKKIKNLKHGFNYEIENK
jgi:hypothetical protein